MRAIAWDTWAFLEVALDKPRRREVDALAADEEVSIFTVRDVVVETFNHLARRTRTAVARDWWHDLRAAPLRILDPDLDALHAFVTSEARSGNVSLTDHALALAARQVGTPEVASEDRDFAAFGLIPLFAP